MKKKLFFSTVSLFLIAHIAISQTLITQARPMDKKEWGYMNLKGEFIIPAQYRRCYEFNEEGYAPIYDEKAKQYYFINVKGEKLPTEVTGFKLMDGFGTNVRGFDNGLVPVRIGDKWGYMNIQGKEAIKPTFTKVTEFNGGYAAVQREGTNIVLNAKGTEIPVTDSKVYALKRFSEGLAPFDTKERNSGFIDVNGKVVIEPKFLSVGYFSNGLAWAKMPDGKVGFINKKGDWAIQPQFTAANNFDAKSGLARIKTGDQWAYVDQSGKVKNLNDSESFDDFREGLCSGKKGGKVGFYDNTGKWVIEPTFEGVRDFKNGYAAAKMDGKWGLIDRTGKWVIQPTLGSIKDMELVK